MDRRVLGRLAVVALIGGPVLVGPATPTAAVASPVVAAPVTVQAAVDELYVSETWCQSGGDGSEQRPFCTISAAAAVAGPGQTVLIQPGDYLEQVRFTRSGTETAPITFRAVNTRLQMARVGNYNTTTVTGPVLQLADVHDVRVEGLVVLGADADDAVTVQDSTRVRLDKLSVHSAINGLSGIRISGQSDQVMLSRNVINGANGPSVSVAPGVTGTTITANVLDNSGLVATDAVGLVITGNTVYVDCRRGIDVAGSSPGTSIRNNIVVTARQRKPCVTPANADGIRVSAGSVPGTSTDYNLIEPLSGGAPYNWAGTVYSDLASFVTATGHATHDIAADPKLIRANAGDRDFVYPVGGSPARDSADATAVGVLDTDLVDASFADDPNVPNSGTGSGYRDRGAVEGGPPMTIDAVRVGRKVGGGPFDIVAHAGWHATWPVERERSRYAYLLEGERFWRVTDSTTAEFTLRRAGDACVKVYVSASDFRSLAGGTERVCTQVGARYVPIAPTRLLDTRAPIGVPTSRPVAGFGSVELPIGIIGGVQAADINAVVLNVTVTQPTSAGFISAYPGGDGSDTSSINFVVGETVPNQVTVPVRNGSVMFYNASSGTVHLVADLQGIYAATGSGFASMPPTRVLDTRDSAGAPISAKGIRTLDLSGRIPATATAAVLSVAVTAPTSSGVLTVYPAGSTPPVASSLNFVARQTIPNLVTVPVRDGEVNIFNNSSGTTHVVADLAGWFSPQATQTFVPMTSRRIVDSRYSLGLPGRTPSPLAAGETAPFAPFRSAAICNPACPAPTALVGNVTVTAPTKPGVLTLHPGGGQRPTASNVNFVAGETASNATVVAVGSGIDLFHNSSGTSHVIVDQAGYFIAAAS
ncbi:right-handed parallel beta-helix repeat-containing protein [Micromonospora taraxaci]|uniref:right-handed parallel beta-helix repeat-containing protein n=1 Tax=Micromonospora taraxaci TaxID=1316803 RepID=UPI0033D1C35D